MENTINTLISNIWTTYYGVLIERKGNQYYTCRKLHNSIEEAKAAIDKSLEQLAKTIK
jgi:hypothetical protein